MECEVYYGIRTDGSRSLFRKLRNVFFFLLQWNSKGYDIAKLFHKKFTLVSPVWLQVRPKQNDKYVMTGSHDIDKDWAAEVTRGGENSLGKH